MNATTRFSEITKLVDRELLGQIEILSKREREATAALIAHLAILDERGLYLAEGCSSLFTYCTQILHYSEYAAINRIETARAARRFPIILEMLADGAVNVTAVRLLAPDLTPANHREVLEAAKHKDKRQILELKAQLRPKPPVPSTVRHQIPDGDIARVMDLALTALIKNLEKEKFTATSRPRPSHGLDSDSRHIPSDVKRVVWARDGGRCAFKAPNGRRCTERGFLEFHHVKPFAMGGKATIDNIQLRCRAHNAYEAEALDFMPLTRTQRQGS